MVPSVTTRETSRDVYHEIRDSGLLSEMRWRAYDVLYRHCPKDGSGLTSAEVFSFEQKENPRKLDVLTQSRARFTELRELGVIKEVGTRPCRITGHKAIAWAPTGHLPRGTIVREPSKLTGPEYVLLRSLWKKGDAEERKALMQAINIIQHRGRRAVRLEDPE